jgi:hypothetical protein
VSRQENRAVTTALRLAEREVITLKRLAPGVDTRPIAGLLGTHLGWRRPPGMTEGQIFALEGLCKQLDLHLPDAGA